jgi:hypothetical protein
MNSIFKRPLWSFVLVFLTIAAFNTQSFAQDLDNVMISGKIVDSNNAPIAGAAVTATLTNNGVERTVIANEEGRYRLIELSPGTYSIKTTMQGFAVQEKTNLVTIAGQNVQLDFNLSPAGVSAEQVITLEGENEPVVDTTRTVVGGTVTQREVEELPNNTRNPLDLVLTLGGVTEEPLSTRDLSDDRGQRGLTAPGTTPEEAGTFALSGGAAYSNNITIDGLDNNDDRSASFRFQPSIESVAEVQVITNQFSAEYGRASGGRVNIRTRAGGNKFRGRAFYFYRNDNLNANTWNNNRRGIARPPLANNDPGVTFSGPILKNKLFFFGSYEYDNIQDTTVADAWVPVTGGNASFPLPAPTDLSRIVTVTATVNATPVSVPIASYVEPVDTPASKHILSARADWNLNNANNFTFGYQLGRSNDLRAFSGTNRIADSLIGRIRDTDGFNATHNLILSSKMVNQFRFQYSTLRPRAAQNAGELSPALLVTFTPPGESSTTQVFGSTTSSSDRKENRFQFQDSFNYIYGTHSIRVGGDFQRVNTQFIDRFDATGTYRFSNFGFFVGNSVSSFQQNFNNTSEVKNNYFGVFVHDDWRLRSNLTLSYGVRYERETVIDDNNNFGPRFAVAWNPFKKGDKTVIRFGGGVFYNRVLLRTIDDFASGSQTLRFDSGSLNVPAGMAIDANVVRNFLSTKVPNALTLDTVFPVNATQSFTVAQLARSSTAFRSLSPDLKIPESYQFNVGFEREIFKGIVFETNVTYNKTVHLWREYNPNAPVLPSNTPERDGRAGITFTDYLLGVTAGNSTFELGSTSDTVGLRTAVNGTCANGATACIVNLNARNNNSTCSATAVTNNPICRAYSVINTLRPMFSTLGAVQFEEVASIGNSRYIGATFELRNRYRKFGHGFGGSMRLVYTLSSLQDDGIVNTSEATIPGDFSREWSRSLLDRRHRLAFTASFDMPKWLGGVRISPLFRFGSSSPFNVSSGGIDRSLDDLSNDRPDFNGDVSSITWRKFDSAFPTSLANQFSLAPIGSPGTLGRNAGKGPKLYVFDLSLTREFKFSERFRLRPNLEFGNILNMTVFSFGSNFINFDLLNSTTPATVAAAQAGFLAPTRTVRPRQIRLGMRFEF